jgi:hypothetical protein
MKFERIHLLLRGLLVLVLSVSSGSVWAVAGTCTYPQSGSGIGGTGSVAKGSGMGGTGIKPETGRSPVHLAGMVTLSQGSVEAQNNGHSRRLALGDPVCEGDTIVTSQSGTVELKMTDDGVVAVRPGTQVKIAAYAYGETEKDRSLLSLFKGAMRIVTGKIGKRNPQNDLVETPVATIGVRGTDHEATVILPGESGGHDAGTYDKVNSGVTFIQTRRGEIDIHANQVGFAPAAEASPILLKEIPDFLGAHGAIREGGAPEAGHGDAGESARGGHPEMGHPEGAMPAGEHPERPMGVERPEAPKVPERPESPSLPERPEAPNAPERPEAPNVPEVPEIPSFPELPEAPSSGGD